MSKTFLMTSRSGMLDQTPPPITPRKEDAAPPSFNDDDWYIVDEFTWTVVRRVGAAAGYKPTPGSGQVVMKGLQARYANLR